MQSILEIMKMHGMDVPSDKVQIKIDDAENIFNNAMTYFLSLKGEKYVKLPEYKDIIEWLTNNDGKGLFLYGDVGLGKPFIARFVIPAILLKYENKIVSFFSVQEMNNNLDYVLTKKLICIDDAGIEELAVNYGNKRLAFLDVLDSAEKHGKLLIVTSNLTSQEAILAKYGERGLDRIISTMKRVMFDGKSLRK